MPALAHRPPPKPSQQLTFAPHLPRWLTPEERAIADANYKLAFGYVRRQGWRFVNIMDYDEQISECMLKLCMVLEQSRASAFSPDKARLSTFADSCFYRHLSSIALRRARVQAVQFSQLEDGGVGFASYDDEPDMAWE